MYFFTLPRGIKSYVSLCKKELGNFMLLKKFQDNYNLEEHITYSNTLPVKFSKRSVRHLRDTEIQRMKIMKFLLQKRTAT